MCGKCSGAFVDFSLMEDSDSSFRETLEPYIASREHVRPTKVAYSDVERGAYLYQGDCLEIMEEIGRKYPKGCFDNHPLPIRRIELLKWRHDLLRWENRKGRQRHLGQVRGARARLRIHKKFGLRCANKCSSPTEQFGYLEPGTSFTLLATPCRCWASRFGRHHLGKLKSATQPVMSLFYSFNRNTLLGRERREEQTYIQLCRVCGSKPVGSR